MSFLDNSEKPLTQGDCFESAAQAGEPSPAPAEVSKTPAETPASETVQNSPAEQEAGKAEESANNADAPLASEEQIRDVLREVYDPEIGLSIIDLGLVYDIIRDEAEGSVHINMTLTSPGCPLGAEMTSAAYLAVSRLPGVKDCKVDLVWSPMWDPEKHPTEEARIQMGFW